MKDRIPKYPGRMKLTHADGTVEYVTMERADEAVEEGTPLNKASLLSDDTAHTLELDNNDDPTVDDAFVNVRRPGDIRLSMRPSITDEWFLCNGGIISTIEYPELAEAMGYIFVDRMNLEGKIEITLNDGGINYIRNTTIRCAFYDAENDVTYLLANVNKETNTTGALYCQLYLLRAEGLETNLENYTVTYVQTNVSESDNAVNSYGVTIKKVEEYIVTLRYYNTGTTNSSSKGFYKSVYDLYGNLTSYQYFTGFKLHLEAPDLVAYAPEFSSEYPYIIGVTTDSNGSNLYSIYTVKNLLTSNAEIGICSTDDTTSDNYSGVKQAFYTRGTLLFVKKRYRNSSASISQIMSIPESSDYAFTNSSYSNVIAELEAESSSRDVSVHLFEGNSASYLFVRANSKSCVVKVESAEMVEADTLSHPYEMLGLDLCAMSYVETQKYGNILVALLSDGNIYKINSENEILDPPAWEIIGKTDVSMVNKYESCTKGNSLGYIMLQDTSSSDDNAIDGLAYAVGVNVKLPELSDDYGNYWIKVK